MEAGWCQGASSPARWVGERQPGFPKLGSLGPTSQGRKLSLEVGNLTFKPTPFLKEAVAQLKNKRERERERLSLFPG